MDPWPTKAGRDWYNAWQARLWPIEFANEWEREHYVATVGLNRLFGDFILIV